MILSYKYHTFNIPLWLLRLLKRHTVYVRAAGGIVTAPDGTMLLILRNGRWDLAKGKVEPGETLLQAALREVQEETGIKASDECGVMSVERGAANHSSLITHQSSLKLYQRVLETSKQWGNEENMMYVVGATKSEMFDDVRRIVPGSFLLVPGVGAQGGSLEEVCKHGLNKDCGLLVNSSRGIIYASNGTDFAEAAAAEARKLQQQMAAVL